jgi:RimJ/RimL family protein N-acetyltransferase
LTHVIAVCGTLNVVSLHVLDKLGFVEESREIQSHVKWPEPREQVRMRVTPQTRRDRELPAALLREW